jgi:hypothetical protein
MDLARLRWIIGGIEWDRLTPWEEDFVESIEAWFKAKGNLTEKQEAIIERIYREKSK